MDRWMGRRICKVSPALWLWWIVSTLSNVCPLVQLSLSCARSAVLFSSGNCLRLKALIQSTNCAVHCCHVHYGYCWYQNYCILNTVPRIGGIVHATSFRIVHSHCPLASLKTEISIIFLSLFSAKIVQVCTVDCWWSVHFFASLSTRCASFDCLVVGKDVVSS